MINDNPFHLSPTYDYTYIPNTYAAPYNHTPDLTKERVAFITAYVLSAQARSEDTVNAAEEAKLIWAKITS